MPNTQPSDEDKVARLSHISEVPVCVIGLICSPLDRSTLEANLSYKMKLCLKTPNKNKFKVDKIDQWQRK